MAKTMFLRGGKHIPPEHQSLAGVATGVANVLESLRVDGLEKDITIIIEGALTGVAIVAERHNLHDQVADLMSSWAADLRARETIIETIAGEA